MRDGERERETERGRNKSSGLAVREWKGNSSDTGSEQREHSRKISDDIPFVAIPSPDYIAKINYYNEVPSFLPALLSSRV